LLYLLSRDHWRSYLEHICDNVMDIWQWFVTKPFIYITRITLLYYVYYDTFPNLFWFHAFHLCIWICPNFNKFYIVVFIILVVLIICEWIIIVIYAMCSLVTGNSYADVNNLIQWTGMCEKKLWTLTSSQY